MTLRDELTSDTGPCERCGTRCEQVHTFGYGGAGSGSGSFVTKHQAPGRADVVLGRPGYLCNRCWWRAVRNGA
jgi:hypothetical protein